MSVEVKKEIELEIAHVLFIDIVGYSKLLIDDQRTLIDTLNQIVRGTAEFQSAEAASKLIKLATGDGMALVFYNRPEAPVECALQISQALKVHPELGLRMGVHSGPVSGVIDVNERANVAGGGINMARRVMECGDAGHILLSKHVADDLEQYGRWRPHLHALGDVEVKHGVSVSIFNLYTDEIGNRQLPEKIRRAKARKKLAVLIIAGVLLAVVLAGGLLSLRYRADPKPNTSTPTGSAIPEKSIAVLPFENRSADKQNAYFADGVQDEILTDVAKVADIKVISRTSVMQYKSGIDRNVREIGKQLGVAHLLEGSVQRAGGKVRVNAQLIDARTDAHLWGQTYDGELADVFTIQSEIAQKIADQLQAKLSPKEKAAIEERPTKDLVAYDLYLRAREFLYDSRGLAPSRMRDAYLEAVQLLNQAIARDPAFLLAYCRLAFAHDQLYAADYDHTEARLVLAEASVRAAVQLQPDAGETHFAQAIHSYWGYLDYDRAREELAKAQRELPNNAEVFQFLGFIDRRQGHWEEAIRNLKHAVDLDPRNIDLVGALGATYFMLRRYEEAIAMYNRALALEPRNNYMRAYVASIRVDAEADTAPLRAVLNRIKTEGQSSTAEVADLSFQLACRERDPAGAARALASMPKDYVDYEIPFPRAWYEGLLAKLRRDAPAAHSAFTAARVETEKVVRAQSKNETQLTILALIDAELGENDKAIREGRTACEMRPPGKDATSGVRLITDLTRIYALAGEKDLALEQLGIIAELPCGPSYGELRLDPEWDSLRGDPRFEEIVASLAPREKL